MADNRTYRTKVYLTCSNSQKNYNFAFDYINSRYVKATINNTQVLQWGTDYTVKGHTLTLVNNPPQGALLLIYRATPTDRTVEWYDSSILRAKDMNLFNTQILHINEESQDELLDSGIREDKLDMKWDARRKQIKNVADPTESSHAVNLGWLSKTQESYLNASQAKVDVATNQANIATAKANTATEKAEVATQQAQSATSSATLASQMANQTSDDRQTIANHLKTIESIHEHIELDRDETSELYNKTKALHSTVLSKSEVVNTQWSTVVSTAKEVEANKDTAVASANTAIDSANTAVSNANTAVASANSARGYSTSAENSAKSALSSAYNAQSSATNAQSQANRANNYATTAVSSATTAVDSANIATQKATESESSATLSKYYAEQAKEASGGDFITNTTFNEALEEMGNALTTAINSHDTDVNAHGGLLANINKELGNKVDTTYFSNVLNDMEALIGSKASQEEFNSWGEGVATILETKADKDTVKVLQNELEGFTTSTSYELEKTKSELDTKMPINGGTFTSNPIIKSGDFSGVILENTTGNKLILEGKPDNRDIIASLFLYDTIEKKGKYYFNFPKQGGTVATLDDVLLKTGGTITGNLTISTGNFSSIQLVNPQGYKLFLENAPNDRDRLGSLISQSDKGVNVYQLNIPKESGVIATQDYVQQVAVKNRRCVTNTGTSGSTWWREWSDGWLEMGGTVDVMKEKAPSISVVTYHNTTVTYPKAFRSVPTTTFSLRSNFSNIRLPHFYEYDKTKFSVDTSNIGTRADYYVGVTWRAQGWKA
ncbi:phage tail fiber protein [Veillonella intestinalis]|uniref:phage tail fiber domain-containing protein n=1 Tax=Veillonella intestinalis TaxID=2941341 RepID=UPI00203E6A2A|nr:phage tail fiber protein [Veillonella intestinalis]